jgi:hypothetical protein
MTKLVTVRVVVPTDDEVTTEQVQLTLRSALEPLGVGRVEHGADREGLPDRIHWSAVDVLRGADRPHTSQPVRKPSKRVVEPLP